MKLTEAEYDALMRQTWRRTCNPTPVPAPDVEPTARNESVGKEKEAGFDAPCSCTISIHSRTKRLADADGRSCKSVIDSLVLAGVIKDDSMQYVSEVSQSQEKTSGDEETIITLRW